MPAMTREVSTVVVVDDVGYEVESVVIPFVESVIGDMKGHPFKVSRVDRGSAQDHIFFLRSSDTNRIYDITVDAFSRREGFLQRPYVAKLPPVLLHLTI